MSSGHRRAEQLVAWAREEGFDQAGIASLAPSRDEEPFRRWLSRGEHAGMSWLASRVEERVDRARLGGGARSVLWVPLLYPPLAGHLEPAGDLWPRVARYARGDDYHDVMEAALRRLARRIEDAFPNTRTRPYVDTGPLLERELAARAGLGAVGKHTNLLHPEHGSWFLLGELLLTLELPPATPLADLCGSCTRCLEACPTGALPEPYRLDANRCISYWTIEHRGTIPTAIRPLLHDWVFGCDLCQEACPWNAAPATTDHPELQLPAARRELDLAALLGLDRGRYVELFRGSPLKRAKRSGLRRNAALAMAHRGDRRYVPALIAALDDPDAELRRHVAWALGRLGGGAARRALTEARSRETDAEVRDEIDAARAALAASSLAAGD